MSIGCKIPRFEEIGEGPDDEGGDHEPSMPGLFVHCHVHRPIDRRQAWEDPSNADRYRSTVGDKESINRELNEGAKVHLYR
jgi:hypothetical protein